MKDVYTLKKNMDAGDFFIALCIQKSICDDYACKIISKENLKSKDNIIDIQKDLQIMHL